MEKETNYRINNYPKLEDLLKSKQYGKLQCGCCGHSPYSIKIYENWGEGVLCPVYYGVTVKAVQDTMSGTSGYVMMYYKNYDDFLYGREYKINDHTKRR